MRPSYVYLRVAAHLLILSGMPAYAQQGAPPPAVLVQVAELRSMTKQAEFVGRAEALEKVDLRARVTGFLGARLFKEGDDVKEGQVVFTIEREPFEATVDQRKAQLASAQRPRKWPVLAVAPEKLSAVKVPLKFMKPSSPLLPE